MADRPTRHPDSLLTYSHIDSCDPRTKDGIYVMRADGSRRRLIREMTADPDDIPEYPVFFSLGRVLGLRSVPGRHVHQARRAAGFVSVTSGIAPGTAVLFSFFLRCNSQRGALRAGGLRSRSAAPLSMLTVMQVISAPSTLGVEFAPGNSRQARRDAGLVTLGDRIVFQRRTFTGTPVRRQHLYRARKRQPSPPSKTPDHNAGRVLPRLGGNRPQHRLCARPERLPRAGIAVDHARTRRRRAASSREPHHHRQDQLAATPALDALEAVGLRE